MESDEQREQRLARKRAYYKEHHEQALARQAAYRQANMEAVRERNRAYVASHKEKYAEYHRAYYQAQKAVKQQEIEEEQEFAPPCRSHDKERGNCKQCGARLTKRSAYPHYCNRWCYLRSFDCYRRNK